MQSVNEIWPVYVISQNKKFYQKIPQKLRPENYFQALLSLQKIKHNLYWKIKHNLYWKIKLLKQATYIKYVLAKLPKFGQISRQTSSDSFLQRIL